MRRSFVVTAATRAVSVVTLALGAVAATAPQAHAQDQLNFTGAARVANGASPDLLALDFLTGNAMSPGRPGTILATETVDGVFAGAIVPGATTGLIQDLTFSAAGVVAAPINPFVTLGGYTFSLTSTPLAGGPTPPSFGPVQLTQVGGSTAAAFAVTGVVTAGPRAVGRQYTGVFTAQFAGQTPTAVFNRINTGGALPVSFSANLALVPASTVPEPSTYALLGAGLSALGAVARRRRARA